MLASLKNWLSYLLDARNGAVLGIINILIVLGILVAGLWPFNFNPVNKVEWIKEGNGIHFYGQGMVVSDKPLAFHQPALNFGSITLEFLICPQNESTTGIPHILTLYDRNTEKFFFGQWKRELIIRIPDLRPQSEKRYREIGVGSVLKKDEIHLITVTSKAERTDVYVDGRLVINTPHLSLVPGGDRLSGYLILGNSPEGTQSWNGTFIGLAIYDRILNGKETLDHYYTWQKSGSPIIGEERKPFALYLFDEHTGDKILDHSGSGNHLLVPATFHPLRSIILGMPRQDRFFTLSNFSDIAVNVLGFVPFGFFLAAWLRQRKELSHSRRYFVVAFLFGLCLSLAIELTQSFIPGRDSSFLDVISNLVGVCAGVILLKYAMPAPAKGDESKVSP